MLSFVTLAVAQPTVNLGPDTGACDSLVLDAGNPGAGYVWSTTELSQSIVVTTSGTYWVDVTDGSGTTRDSIVVIIAATPSAPTVADLDICGSGLTSISASSSADEIQWFDSPSSTQPVAIGHQVDILIPDSTTLYLQASNFGSLDSIQGTEVGSSPQYITGSRGTTFDVFTSSILKSITLYSVNPGSIRIQLEDDQLNILDSMTVVVSQSGFTATPVQLNFDLPAGTGYRLLGEQVSGGFAVDFNNTAYPFTVPGIISLTGSKSGATSRFSYFFDWVVIAAFCPSPMISMDINVLQAPILDLGPDRSICGTSLVLDATYPGASYLWNTTETTPSIIVSTPGTYSVASSIGSCTIMDTVIIGFTDQPNPPMLNDLDICGPGLTTLISTSPADEIMWFDSPTSTQPIAIGHQVDIFIPDTTTLYVQANNYASFNSIPGTGVGSSPQYITGSRGTTFDVFTPSILKSITLYSINPGSITIQLEDNQQNILDSMTVVVSQSGFTATPVQLNFDLAAGTGYRLLGEQVSGGFAVDFSNTAYPFTVPGMISLTGSKSGATDRFSYFFDWQVARSACRSSLTSIMVNVLESPMIELGQDTAICGLDYVLDASFPGASYLWSTTETTPSITISSDGIYTVIGNIGSCMVEDSIYVEFATQPTIPLFSDTSICGPGMTTLSVLSSADEIQWFDSPTSVQPVAIGHQVDIFIPDTTTLYIQGNNFASFDSIQGTELGNSPQYITGSRGTTFDVFAPSILKSITLYSVNPGSIRIQFEDNQQNILDSMTIVVSQSGFTATTVQLNFDLPTGTGYRLLGEQVSGGFAVDFNNTSYPFTVPGIISLTGSKSGATDRFSYFFNWEVARTICSSPLASLDVIILPAPEFDLGSDRAVCGSSLVLDASSPGSSYLWSTGETTSSITISQTDTFSVNASLGSCQVEDTVFIELVPEPSTLIPYDTTVCGNGEVFFTTQNDADEILWYADAVSEVLISDQDSFFLFIQDTTTVYAEAVNHSTLSHVGIVNFSLPLASYQSNLRGVSFDVFQPLVLKAVTLFANQETQATILLEDELGNPLDSVKTTLQGDVPNRVSLYFDLPEGQNFRLLAKDVVGGGLAFYSTNINYPYIVPDQISLNSSQNGSTSSYYYFYDWEIVQKVCVGPRTPVTVTVALPLNLGENLYSCDPVLLDAGTPSASHLWSTGAMDQIISVDQSGAYWVEISDNTGCVSADTIEITIPELFLGDDGTLCGTTLVTGYDTSSVFIWNTGAVTPDLPLTNSGTYWVTVDEPLGCTLTDTIVVTGFADFPIVDLGMDFSECDSAILDAGNAGLSFVWSTGDTTQMISIQSAGVYEVSVTNEFDCTTTDEINVFIAPAPVAEFNPISNGPTVFFENLSSLGSNFWDFGDGNTSNMSSPTHTYQDTGTYIVRLILVDILNNCGSDTFYSTIQIRSTTHIDGLVDGGTIEAYPNPTRESLFVKLSQVPAGEVRFILSDMRGKALVKKLVVLTDTDHVEKLSIPQTSPGLYVLRVQTQKGYTLHKILIQ